MEATPTATPQTKNRKLIAMDRHTNIFGDAFFGGDRGDIGGGDREAQTMYTLQASFSNNISVVTT